MSVTEVMKTYASLDNVVQQYESLWTGMDKMGVT